MVNDKPYVWNKYSYNDGYLGTSPNYIHISLHLEKNISLMCFQHLLKKLTKYVLHCILDVLKERFNVTLPQEQHTTNQ